MPASAVRAPADRRGRLAAVLGVLALVLLGATWGVATPPGSSPDEPSHIYHSWAVVTGQAFGDTRSPDDNPDELLVRGVGAVADFVQPGCYAFDESQPVATCPEPLLVGEDEGVSYMNRYPVAYYLPAGAWLVATEDLADEGSLLPLVLLRVMSGMASGVVLALAGMVLLRRYPLPVVVPVVVVALTPTAWFLSGTVNPNGMEVAASALLAALVLAARHDLNRVGRVGTGLAVALPLVALLLVNVRPVSVAWAALLLACLLLPVRTPGAARGRPALLLLPAWSTVAAVLVGLAAAAWFLWAAGLRADDTAADEGFPWQEVGPVWRLVLVQLRLGREVEEAVATFGWVDTTLPQALVVLWLAFVVLLLVRWADGGPTPEMPRWVPVGVVVGGMLVVTVHSLSASFGWQGRYYLPFLTGAAVLCCAGAARSLSAPGFARSSLLAASAVGWCIQAVSVLWAMGRHAYGTTEVLPRFDRLPLPSLSRGGEWVPLGGPGTVLVLAVVVALLGLLVHLLVWSRDRRDRRDRRGSATPEQPAPLAPAVA